MPVKSPMFKNSSLFLPIHIPHQDVSQLLPHITMPTFTVHISTAAISKPYHVQHMVSTFRISTNRQKWEHSRYSNKTRNMFSNHHLVPTINIAHQISYSSNTPHHGQYAQKRKYNLKSIRAQNPWSTKKPPHVNIALKQNQSFQKRYAPTPSDNSSNRHYIDPIYKDPIPQTLSFGFSRIHRLRVNKQTCATYIRTTFIS